MHLELWTLYERVLCSYFQQFLHYRTPGFIFTLQIVAMWLPTLKHLFVKIVDGRLYFIFSFHFIFFFLFKFLFLEQLRLGFISHTVTWVTNWWHSHKTDHRTWENEVKGSGTKWRHTAWTTHAGLMLYSWSFRVGYTVASMDHG